MKKILSLILAVSMGISLVACGSTSSSENTESAAIPRTTTAEAPTGAEVSSESEVAFTEKAIPVIRDSLDSTETAAVRYYEDLPNVPYMNTTDFYDQFYLINTEIKEGMTFKQDGSRYTLSNFCGDDTVFDIETDTIEIVNTERFIKLATDLQTATGNNSIDPDYPYAMLTHTMDPEEPALKTLELSDYDIDLRGDDTGVYVPLPTLADIFASASGYYVVYAGEKIYVRDFVGLYLDSVMEEDPDYFTAIKSDRTDDMAQYTYNELCFNMDLWYGKPGQEYIHKDLDSGKKLDEILTEEYPEIKGKLLAKDFETFYGGLIHLFAGLLFDGGHTGMACNALMDDEFDLSTKFFKEARAEDYGVAYNRYVERIGHGALREEARESFYNGDYYVEKGDTAVICFNKFVVDNDAWRAFLAGETERPLIVEDPETGGETYDTVGVMLAGLERAKKNPEIKNIIIDNTCNGGGNDIAMLAIEWLATGKGYIRDWNAITEQYNTKEEVFDFNHDGKIDDSDVSPYTDYNYGVLTSDGSFSCGNAFPFFMHEHGAMILGEKSSGGACGVRLSSVGGIEVQNSAASSCTVTDEGETVDNGCPVDAELISSGDNPYENFYDLENLGEQMNKYFDEARENAA